MSEQGQEVYRTGETWLRLLLMIVYFGLVFYLVKILIGASLVFQSVMVVVRGTVNPRLQRFTADLNRFCYSTLQYLTWNTDQRPFPFCDWPSPDEQPSPDEKT
jgi:hypothetical protein|tara:strand:+ start:2202 stop:2510 length:309 start_codon:yes stop_codon:yes gene_type:complete